MSSFWNFIVQINGPVMLNDLAPWIIVLTNIVTIFIFLPASLRCTDSFMVKEVSAEEVKHKDFLSMDGAMTINLNIKEVEKVIFTWACVNLCM